MGHGLIIFACIPEVRIRILFQKTRIRFAVVLDPVCCTVGSGSLKPDYLNRSHVWASDWLCLYRNIVTESRIRIRFIKARIRFAVVLDPDHQNRFVGTDPVSLPRMDYMFSPDLDPILRKARFLFCFLWGVGSEYGATPGSGLPESDPFSFWRVGAGSIILVSRSRIWIRSFLDRICNLVIYGPAYLRPVVNYPWIFLIFSRGRIPDKFR